MSTASLAVVQPGAARASDGGRPQDPLVLCLSLCKFAAILGGSVLSSPFLVSRARGKAWGHQAFHSRKSLQRK